MARRYAKGAEILPGFHLVKVLGRGGFGEVWEATAPGGTRAAIKIIPLGDKAGRKEYRALQLVKQLRHPNLVPILAFWLVDEHGKTLPEGVDPATLEREWDLLLAMGLCDSSLADRLRECRRQGLDGIPGPELLAYLDDAARALDFLNQPVHDLGDGQVGALQHCDVKPQNLLLVGGAVQVCDFGLARVLGEQNVSSIAGTAAYMAPELISGSPPTRTTDQYFLAISYVELRTGSLPFDSRTPAAVMYAHAMGALDLTKLPEVEQPVVRRAVSLDPAKRYPSNAAFVQALREASSGRPPAAPRGSLDSRLTPGGEIVPGYRLVRSLGQGSFGEVWEASAPGGKLVALKVIRDLDRQQGRQEFHALELIKDVDHNHLMELHAFWLLDSRGEVIADEARDRGEAGAADTLVIASRLADQNLLQRLHDCQRAGHAGIPVPELLSYMAQAADALDYLNAPRHRVGNQAVSIVHRDVKPENILLASGVVKVGDFGLARVLEGQTSLVGPNSAGLTLDYAAPELFTQHVTAWTDQYSLAITYVKLRTGRLPLPPNIPPTEIGKRHLQGRLDLSLLPEAEREVIRRAANRVAEQRFPTCGAFVARLTEAAAASEDRALPAAPARKRATELRLKKVVAPTVDELDSDATWPEDEPAPIPPPSRKRKHASTVERPVPASRVTEERLHAAKGTEREMALPTVPIAPPVPAVPADRPPSRWSRVGLALAMLSLAIAGLLVGGWAIGTWDVLLEAQVNEYAARSEFARAVDRADHWLASTTLRQRQRARLQPAWRGHVVALLASDPDEALAQIEAFQARYPDDEIGERLRREARFTVALHDGAYVDAARLAEKEPGWTERLRTSWLASIVQQADADGASRVEAARSCRAFLGVFSGDESARELLGGKLFREATVLRARDAAERTPPEWDEVTRLLRRIEPDADAHLRPHVTLLAVRAAAANDPDLERHDWLPSLLRLRRPENLADSLDGNERRQLDALVQSTSRRLAQTLGPGNAADKARAHARLASLDAFRDDYLAADRHLLEATSLDPTVREFWIAWAELALDQVEDDQAIDLLVEQRLHEARLRADRALALDRDDAEARRIRARAFEKHRDFKAARDEYRAGLPEPTKASPAQLPLALARLEAMVHGRWPDPLAGDEVLREAAHVVALATRPDPDPSMTARAKALEGTARCRFRSSEIAAGIAELREAIALSPAHRDSWQWRLDLARQLRDTDRAEAVRLLHEAELRAPSSQRKKAIRPLLAELEPS